MQAFELNLQDVWYCGIRTQLAKSSLGSMWTSRLTFCVTKPMVILSIVLLTQELEYHGWYQLWSVRKYLIYLQTEINHKSAKLILKSETVRGAWSRPGWRNRFRKYNRTTNQFAGCKACGNWLAYKNKLVMQPCSCNAKGGMCGEISKRDIARIANAVPCQY